VEIKSNSQPTKTSKIPTLRAKYALALIQSGNETVVTFHDQKRLLSARYATLDKSGNMQVTVKGLGFLNGAA
jgi:hypothetical protein